MKDEMTKFAVIMENCVENVKNNLKKFVQKYWTIHTIWYLFKRVFFHSSLYIYKQSDHSLLQPWSIMPCCCSPNADDTLPSPSPTSLFSSSSEIDIHRYTNPTAENQQQQDVWSQWSTQNVILSAILTQNSPIRSSDPHIWPFDF